MKNNIFLRLIFLFTVLTLLGCDEPGMGPKAEKGYRACNPIVEALARFYADKKAYPVSLYALVPAYLPSFETKVNDYPIRYEQSTKSFKLRFSYEGPGMNNCDFTPEIHWHCEGHF